MNIFWLTEIILISLAGESHRAKFLYEGSRKQRYEKGGLESFTANRYAALCFNQNTFLGVQDSPSFGWSRFGT